MTALRRLGSMLTALALVLLALAVAPAAIADDRPSLEKGLASADWSAHPGAAVAGLVAMIAGALLAAAGVGCAVALVGAVVPRLRDGVDAAGRAASAGRMWLIGCSVLGGVLLANAAASKAGVESLAVATALVLGVPTLALFLVGALGAVPLLGERLLGAGGAVASPIRRCVTATLALGVGLFPAFVPALAPLAFLVGLVGLAWPLGVGIEAATRLFSRRA